MDARCTTQSLALGRNTKGMAENNGAEAMEVGPNGGGGRLNSNRQIWEERTTRIESGDGGKGVRLALGR